MRSALLTALLVVSVVVGSVHCVDGDSAPPLSKVGKSHSHDGTYNRGRDPVYGITGTAEEVVTKGCIHAEYNHMGCIFGVLALFRADAAEARAGEKCLAGVKWCVCNYGQTPETIDCKGADEAEEAEVGRDILKLNAEAVGLSRQEGSMFFPRFLGALSGHEPIKNLGAASLRYHTTDSISNRPESSIEKESTERVKAFIRGGMQRSLSFGSLTFADDRHRRQNQASLVPVVRAEYTSANKGRPRGLVHKLDSHGNVVVNWELNKKENTFLKQPHFDKMAWQKQNEDVERLEAAKERGDSNQMQFAHEISGAEDALSGGNRADLVAANDDPEKGDYDTIHTLTDDVVPLPDWFGREDGDDVDKVDKVDDVDKVDEVDEVDKAADESDRAEPAENVHK